MSYKLIGSLKSRATALPVANEGFLASVTYHVDLKAIRFVIHLFAPREGARKNLATNFDAGIARRNFPIKKSISILGWRQLEA